MSLQTSYHICYLALPRPAFHLAAPPQPHSQRLPPLLAGSAAAPQRAAAADTPPLQSMQPWPGTRQPAATGSTGLATAARAVAAGRKRGGDDGGVGGYDGAAAAAEPID